MVYANLEGNIYPEIFNEQASRILDWIRENPNTDPNAYEMTNLFLLGAKYAHEGFDINVDTLTKMWNIRSGNFEQVGISKDNFVYRICEDSYKSVVEDKPLVNDEASHHALRKMAAIGLWLKQQQRDGETLHYDNTQELLQLVEASRTLKGVHPELFDKYKFMDNLNVLSRLQPENVLSGRISDAMQQLNNEKTTNIEGKTSKEEITR